MLFSARYSVSLANPKIPVIHPMKKGTINIHAFSLVIPCSGTNIDLAIKISLLKTPSNARVVPPEYPGIASDVPINIPVKTHFSIAHKKFKPDRLEKELTNSTTSSSVILLLAGLFINVLYIMVKQKGQSPLVVSYKFY